MLVVDDDDGVRKLLTRLLRQHALVMCDNAASALAFIADGGMVFDAILCDLWMTPIDGPAFYRELGRVRPDLQGRVVFITGDGGTPRILEFLAGAARPVLEKPFDPEELRAAVAKVQP